LEYSIAVVPGKRPPCPRATPNLRSVKRDAECRCAARYQRPTRRLARGEQTSMSQPVEAAGSATVAAYVVQSRPRNSTPSGVLKGNNKVVAPFGAQRGGATHHMQK